MVNDLPSQGVDGCSVHPTVAAVGPTMPRGRSRPIGSTSAIELSGTTLRITCQGTGMPFQWLLSAPPIRGCWIVWQTPTVFSAARAGYLPCAPICVDWRPPSVVSPQLARQRTVGDHNARVAQPGRKGNEMLSSAP